MVGLGNPGKRYANNRHNIGFRVIDHIRGTMHAPIYRTRAYEMFCDTRREWCYVKPMLYMNRSGEALQLFFKDHGVTDTMLIMHDDLDIPFGYCKFSAHKGSGGHNGIASIIAHMGADIHRLRIGIDRPDMDGRDYVLSDFPAAQEERMPLLLAALKDAAAYYARNGLLSAANRFNKTSLLESEEGST